MPTQEEVLENLEGESLTGNRSQNRAGGEVMTSDWETFQELVKAEMRKVYSETAIEHAMNPRNVGNMDNADGYASITGPCGDAMEIWFKVRNNIITEATFMTDDCGTSIASGSMVTKIAKGKTCSFDCVYCQLGRTIHPLGEPKELIYKIGEKNG